MRCIPTRLSIFMLSTVLLTTQAMAGAAVRTMQVHSSYQAQSLVTQGTIAAHHDVILSTQQSGTIAHVFFHNGQMVKQGAPLFALNSNELHAQLVQAQAQAALSQLQYKRMQQLIAHASGGVSQAAFDKARATYQQDAAQVNYYQVQIAQRTVRAPFAGVTGKRLVSLGGYVEPGDHLVRLLSNQDLTADYTLPSEDRQFVRLGQSVIVSSLKPPLAKSHATVSYISPFIDQSTRTIGLQAVLNHDTNFYPGEFVAIQQKLDAQRKVFRIPVNAVMNGLQGPYVYRVVGDRVRVQFVKATIHGAYADVSSGLQQGDRIVVAGLTHLHDGSKITNN